MSPASRFAAVLLLLSCATEFAYGAQLPLERGTAITDPAALREFDRGRFGLGRLLRPERSADIPLTTGQLFALPAMAPVRRSLDAEFDRYIARHRASLPDETVGVGEGFAFQLFDRALLDSSDTRFVLSGIVNRMDRAYVAPENCGEIRLIYRLAQILAPSTADQATLPRLPMTLNVVLKAKGDLSAASSCGEIAGRWLAAAQWPQTGAELVEKWVSKDGPLERSGYLDIDRIETNLQIAHAPKSALRDFRTDYLLKVFRYDPAAQRFAEAPLENQIDRDRLLADESLRQEFKAWLLDPEHFSAFDRGTLLIPEKFLSAGAVAPTPVGFDVSGLQPAFGLMQGEGAAAAVFSDDDVVGALKRAAERGVKLQNIRSPAGFERRLNDITCSGCHQTRGIGGFHFPGVDWMAAKPSNAAVVPASPHFFGDQVRRRDILTSLRDGRVPDYSRGFSSRPQSRGSTELAGTEYDDGWGAHCYQPGTRPAISDRSFAGFTCAEGLTCQVAGKTSRMGMCFVGSR